MTIVENDIKSFANKNFFKESKYENIKTSIIYVITIIVLELSSRMIMMKLNINSFDYADSTIKKIIIKDLMNILVYIVFNIWMFYIINFFNKNATIDKILRITSSAILFRVLYLIFQLIPCIRFLSNIWLVLFFFSVISRLHILVQGKKWVASICIIFFFIPLIFIAISLIDIVFIQILKFSF